MAPYPRCWLTFRSSGAAAPAPFPPALPQEEQGLGPAVSAGAGTSRASGAAASGSAARAAHVRPGGSSGSRVGVGDRDRDRDRDRDTDTRRRRGLSPFLLGWARPGHSGAGRGGWVRAAASLAGLLWFSSRSFLRRLLSPKRGAMTSLAEQLKRLALPQNDPSLLDRSEVASLLFTCKEAATIDRDTFFAIGEFVCLDTTCFKNIPENSWREINRKNKPVFRKGKRIVEKAAV